MHDPQGMVYYMDTLIVIWFVLRCFDLLPPQCIWLRKDNKMHWTRHRLRLLALSDYIVPFFSAGRQSSKKYPYINLSFSVTSDKWRPLSGWRLLMQLALEITGREFTTVPRKRKNNRPTRPFDTAQLRCCCRHGAHADTPPQANFTSAH